METIYFYLDDTIVKNHKASYAVLKVTAKTASIASDKAKQYANEKGFRLAGGYFTKNAIPGDFKTQYTVINLPKNYRLKKREPDLTDRIIAYEMGTLSDKETIKLFQELVDTGMVNNLQGHYWRTAQNLINAGYVRPPREKTNRKKYRWY